jgi:hypothetical protein
MNSIKFVLLAMLLLLSGCAAIGGRDGKITDEVEVMWYTKGQIYTASKAWIAEFLSPPIATIAVDDREFGRILGFAKVPYPCTVGPDCVDKASWTFGYTFEVTMENQKFVIALSNMRLSYPAHRTSNGKNQPATDRPLTKSEITTVGQPTLLNLSRGLTLEIQKTAAIR